MTDQTYTNAIKLMTERVRSAVAIPVFLPNDGKSRPIGPHVEIEPNFGRGIQTGFSKTGIREESFGFLECKVAVPKGSNIGTATALIDQIEPYFTCKVDGCLFWENTSSNFDSYESDSHYKIPFLIYFRWIRHKRSQ